MMMMATVYMYIKPYQKFYINVLEAIVIVDMLILLLIASVKVCIHGVILQAV